MGIKRNNNTTPLSVPIPNPLQLQLEKWTKEGQLASSSLWNVENIYQDSTVEPYTSLLPS